MMSSHKLNKALRACGKMLCSCVDKWDLLKDTSDFFFPPYAMQIKQNRTIMAESCVYGVKAGVFIIEGKMRALCMYDQMRNEEDNKVDIKAPV